MNQERRLSAIMFTDIVGSTAMMQKDEQMAVAAVSKHKKVLESAIPAFHGEIINFYGDGSLSIFNSVTSVLECAMDIQMRMQTELYVPLRIGIHIGEILLQDGEVFGDGVNIASRIESLGQAGTVFFSEEIYHKIRNNKQFQTALIGDFHFKNVDAPMAVYAIANKGFPVPKKETLTGKLKDSDSEKPQNTEAVGFKKIFGFLGLKKEKALAFTENNFAKSIAVLPFEKSNNLNEHDYLADSIADEVRSRLYSIKDLKVISRSSCQHYRGKSIPPKKIGKELGVQYLLEGRVQMQEAGAMVYAELSNTHDDSMVWSMPYTRLNDANIVNLQNQIARQVVDELKLSLSSEENTQLNTLPTQNPEAFLVFRKGQDMLHRGYGSAEELQQAADYFQLAVQLDPNFTKAWIGLTETYLEFIFWGRAARTTILEKAMSACMKALELDPNSGEAWGGLGALNFYKFEFEKAKKHLNQAIELSPGYVEAYTKLGWITAGEDDLEKSIHYFKKSLSLDPLSTKYLGDIGQVYGLFRKYEDGIIFTENALREHPNDSWLLWILGSLYNGKGDYGKAVEIFKMRPGGQMNWLLGYAYAKLGKLEEANAILDYNLNKRKTVYVPAHMLAITCLGLGQTDDALYWLEQDMDEGSLSLIFLNLKTDPIFDVIRDNPRFQAIITRKL